MFSLTWDSSRNDHDVRPGQRLLHAIVGWEVAVDLRDGRDVGEICGDTGGVDDIVEAKVVDERARLQEEGQWLVRWIS